MKTTASSDRNSSSLYFLAPDAKDRVHPARAQLKPDSRREGFASVAWESNSPTSIMVSSSRDQHPFSARRENRFDFGFNLPLYFVPGRFFSREPKRNQSNE
ncbi:hypothetical protein NPIL_526151 [Nephila pilipes]|uniref:Uncharacterized protein n=1 Tax=Nephila pilipes TaxID=299642 RepID=A0A8X6Q099_NEPPI|nr:hypothetical protein NPIL_526151 [Nephila pilipes]